MVLTYFLIDAIMDPILTIDVGYVSWYKLQQVT